MAEFKDQWNEEVENKNGTVNVLLMKDSQGDINYMALIIVYCIPLISLATFCTTIKTILYGEEETELDSDEDENEIANSYPFTMPFQNSNKKKHDCSCSEEEDHGQTKET